MGEADSWSDRYFELYYLRAGKYSGLYLKACFSILNYTWGLVDILNFTWGLVDILKYTWGLVNILDYTWKLVSVF